jgi:hypothetical protein
MATGVMLLERVTGFIAKVRGFSDIAFLSRKARGASRGEKCQERENDKKTAALTLK